MGLDPEDLRFGHLIPKEGSQDPHTRLVWYSLEPYVASLQKET